MKKLLLLLIPTLLLCSLASCDDDDNEIKFFVNSTSTKTAYLFDFEEILVRVQNANGTYSVKSNDESIITAEIDKNGFIIIKAQKRGSSSIVVTDSEKKTATLEVFVIAKMDFFGIENHIVSVKAENQSAGNQNRIKEIEEEIKNQLPVVGGLLELEYTSADEGTFSFYLKASEQTDKIIGTFRCELGYGIPTYLTLKYEDGKKIKYMISNDGTKTSPAPTIRFLVRDFIDDYKDLNDIKIIEAKGTLKTYR